MESKNRPHILIIDDDREILKILDGVLSMAGFRVRSCADGIEGIRIAEEENPDLIILDVLMPGKNGIEVMREIRTNPATKAIPILFLSAVGDEATVVQGLKGADDYVDKQIGPLELEARIRKILDRVGKRGETRPDQELPLSSRIPIKLGKETYFLPLKDILYLEAAGKYSYAHIREKRYLTGFSISELDKSLGGDEHFIRINRSYMVNIEHILKVTRDAQKKLVIVVADEKHSELRVGKSYLQSVKERLGI
ncbi:MAG: response regulator [Actinobacteria bacterium]|nr:response regulator [Actinomycetota bacterium]